MILSSTCLDNHLLFIKMYQKLVYYTMLKKKLLLRNTS